MRSIVMMAMLTLAGLSYADETAPFSTDAKALLQEAKESAAAQKTKTADMWVKQDCKPFVFEENSPAVSLPQDFHSETWMQMCIDVPAPPHQPGTCIPLPPQLMAVDEKTVKVSVQDRLVPGPKEVFEVCLWGPHLHLRVKQSPNKYSVEEKAESPSASTFVLTKRH
jgi:hypothetical protein